MPKVILTKNLSQKKLFKQNNSDLKHALDLEKRIELNFTDLRKNFKAMQNIFQSSPSVENFLSDFRINCGFIFWAIQFNVDLHIGNVIIFDKINSEKPRESLSIC